MTTTNSDATDIARPAFTPSRQKVVLEHTNGPHKGLLQIMGKVEDWQRGNVDLSAAAMPAEVSQ